MKLSDHFTLEELTFSENALRQGIANIPSPAQIDNLTHVANWLLEPIRSLLAVPIHINSGYRSPTVNAAVGGASSSAHLDGRAADIVPMGFPLLDAFDVIQRMDIDFDQVIQECGPIGWVHVAIAPAGQKPRKEVLKATGGPGHWVYTRVT